MTAALKAEATLTPVEMIEAAAGGMKHICQEAGFMVEQESKSATAISQNPEVYFNTPATSILWPDEIGKRDEMKSLLVNVHFHSSHQKSQALDQVKDSIASLTKSSALLAELMTLSDEFITNAVYNAPFVDPVTGTHKKIDRSHTVDLPKEKSGRIFLAEDGQRLVIGVQDPFGSLNIGTYLERTRQCYIKGLKDSINFGPGGAGIGSFLIFNTGSSLYFGVKPGVTTIMACVVPYRLSGRRRQELPKHLHWIQEK